MSTAARHTGVDDQVADLRWPAEAARRERLAHEGRPRLLVVDHGEAPPPCWDGLEDWVRPDADAIERYVRRERLRRLARARAPRRSTPTACCTGATSGWPCHLASWPPSRP